MKTPLLATDNFDMIPLQEGDTEAYFKGILSDVDVAKYCAWSPYTDIKDAESLIKQEIEKQETDTYYGWGLFFDNIVDGVNTPVLFGHIELDIDLENKFGSVSFNIMKPYWRKGYASQALSKVVEYSFSTLGLDSLGAVHHVDNRVSGRVLENAGFSRMYSFHTPWKVGEDAIMLRYQMSKDVYFFQGRE